MSVTEAAIHKDDRMILAHHNVWMSRQSRMVQPVTKPMIKEIPPNQYLRFGILAVYGCHTPAALFFAHFVYVWN